jgi:hypothetical protein
VIETPPFMISCEHYLSRRRFHRGHAGRHLIAEKGYQSFSQVATALIQLVLVLQQPFLAASVEADADMDLHDDQWVAREVGMGLMRRSSFVSAARNGTRRPTTRCRWCGRAALTTWLV